MEQKLGLDITPLLLIGSKKLRRHCTHLIFLVFLGVSACSGQGAGGQSHPTTEKLVYDSCFGLQPEPGARKCEISEKQKKFLIVIDANPKQQPEKFREFLSLYSKEERDGLSISFFDLESDEKIVLESHGSLHTYGIFKIGHDIYYFVPRNRYDFYFVFEEMTYR